MTINVSLGPKRKHNKMQNLGAFLQGGIRNTMPEFSRALTLPSAAVIARSAHNL